MYLTFLIFGMYPCRNVQVRKAKVRLIGSHHKESDGESISKHVEEFEPDVVCMEANPRLDAAVHTPDVAIVRGATRENNAKFWHIDAYDSDVSMSEVMSNMSKEEKNSVTGRVGDLESSREMRDAMREASNEGHEYNLRRESTMFATVCHAIGKYDKVLVVVGSAHFSQVYELLTAM